MPPPASHMHTHTDMAEMVSNTTETLTFLTVIRSHILLKTYLLTCMTEKLSHTPEKVLSCKPDWKLLTCTTEMHSHPFFFLVTHYEKWFSHIHTRNTLTHATKRLFDHSAQKKDFLTHIKFSHIHYRKTHTPENFTHIWKKKKNLKHYWNFTRIWKIICSLLKKRFVYIHYWKSLNALTVFDIFTERMWGFFFSL